jgi:hypothetical protein
MNVREVAPRLYYWTAPHPAWHAACEWPEDVGCVCYRTSEATVLIDPLLPQDGEEAFWQFVDAPQLPVEVLLTAPWHRRDAYRVAERCRTTVWAHELAASRVDFPTRSDDLPAGVGAFVPEGDDEGQVAFHFPDPQTLVVGEFLVGSEHGLKLNPSPALRDAGAFRRSMRKLLDLPIERVLVAHGEPVLRDGRRAVAKALDA